MQRDQPRPAPLPRIAYADQAVRAYRRRVVRRRRWVLAGVAAWMLARRRR